MMTSSNSSKKSTRQPAFEMLEERTLLSAIPLDWAGAWTLNGFKGEADTSDSSASMSYAPIVANATIVDLGGGNYSMSVPKYNQQFSLQAAGSELHGDTQGPNDGDYEQQYIRMVPINDNAVLFMLGSGGFPNSSEMQLDHSTGVVGLATRGNVAVTNRPWVGEYSLDGYRIEAQNGNGPNPGSVAISSDAGTVQMTDIGGGKYSGEQVGQGSVTFSASGKGLLCSQSVTEPDGSSDDERIWVFRGPDDTGYVLDAGVTFRSGHAAINDTWFSAGVLRPEAGSEYAPDLSAEIIGTGGDVLPGETVTVPVKISNTGTAPATGKINIDLWTDANAVAPTVSKLQSIKIAAGSSVTINLSFVVPANTAPGSWDIHADVDTTNVIAELDETNNSAQATFFNVVWDFGTVGGRAGHKLNLTDADGTVVTFSLTGPGTGTVSDIGGQWGITLDGNTTSSTAVSVATRRGGPGDGKTVLASVTAPSPIKSFSAPTTQLAGPMSLTAVSAAGVTISLADVNCGSIDSAMPIQSLTAGQWLDASGIDADLNAPSIAKITVAHDFQGDVVVTGNLGTSTIGGNVTGSLWDVGGTVTKMTVTGDVGQSIVRSGLDILSLTIGSSTGSDFGAGISTDVLTLNRHALVGDAPTGTIKAFTIKGNRRTPTVDFFADSNISAGIGKLTLVNWDGQGGLFAPAGKIVSIKYTDLANPSNNWVYPTHSVSAGPGTFINVV